ncbi:hypothetical protein PVAP13_7NG086889 [Panicum virgatum]|uniref:Uncharacterized protein n=1 Tax=Panicum virgatum TaxID=38727 RepID=A0A8T0PRB5_PANVG|nr:hypothetical protein PVAP13_7NG086889 [Panicum virgatum]
MKHVNRSGSTRYEINDESCQQQRLVQDSSCAATLNTSPTTRSRDTCATSTSLSITSSPFVTMESASSTQVPLCVLNAGFLSDLPFSGISLNTCTFVASATIVVISPTTVTATSSTTWSKVSRWNVRLAKNTFHSLPWLYTSWMIAHSGRHCQRLPQACLPCLTSGLAPPSGLRLYPLSTHASRSFVV